MMADTEDSTAWRSAWDKMKRKAQNRWIDSIKEDHGALGMTITQVSRTAQVRNNWRNTINGLPMHA